MTWHEKHPQDRSNPTQANAERAALFEELKGNSLPIISRDQGQKPISPVQFQPVVSPGIYEGEFAAKDGDIIFHFWPHGYHAAERSEQRTPTFSKDFQSKLKQCMEKEFQANRVRILDDRDIGAITVFATGWGDSTFFRELGIRVMKSLHLALGGEDS